MGEHASPSSRPESSVPASEASAVALSRPASEASLSGASSLGVSAPASLGLHESSFETSARPASTAVASAPPESSRVDASTLPSPVAAASEVSCASASASVSALALNREPPHAVASAIRESAQLLVTVRLFTIRTRIARAGPALGGILSDGCAGQRRVVRAYSREIARPVCANGVAGATSPRTRRVPIALRRGVACARRSAWTPGPIGVR